MKPFLSFVFAAIFIGLACFNYDVHGDIAMALFFSLGSILFMVVGLGNMIVNAISSSKEN